MLEFFLRFVFDLVLVVAFCLFLCVCVNCVWFNFVKIVTSEFFLKHGSLIPCPRLQDLCKKEDLNRGILGRIYNI